MDTPLEIASNGVTSLSETQRPAAVASKAQENENNIRTAPEETLESHEVIELHAFIERKTWIEEKIQVGFNISRNSS